MKLKRKISVFLLAALMIFTASCGGKTEPESKLSGAVPKFYLETSVIDSELPPQSTMFYQATALREDGFFTLLAITSDGENLSLKRLRINDDKTVSVDDLGLIDAMKNYIALTKTDSGYSAVYLTEDIPATLVSEEYDNDFKLVKTVKSDFSFYGLSDFFSDGTYYYALYYDENDSDNIARFSLDLSVREAPYLPNESAAQFAINSIALGIDGKAYISYSEYGANYHSGFIPFVTEKTDFSLSEIPDSEHSNRIFTGEGDYLLFGTDSSYIYGYKADGTADTLMPISDLDINNNSYILTSAVPSGNLRTSFARNFEDYTLVRYDFSLKIPEKDERIALTLSTDNASQDITEAVAAFNRISTKYRVDIVDLNDRSNLQMNGFDKAILDGTLGDILFPPEWGNENYIEKGLYTDLYPYLDADETISRDDFIPGLLSALETDGKLLRLWNGVSIETYLAPEGAPPPTFENIYKLTQELPEEYILGGYTDTPDSALYNLLLYNIGFFDDTEKLAGEEMRTLLEICKHYGSLERKTSDDYVSPFGFGNDTYYKSAQFGNVSGFIIDSEVDTGGRGIIVPVGNPVPSGEPKPYLTGRDIAIYSGSDKKDAAWEFIKFYAGYTENHYMGFHVLRDDYGAVMEETLSANAALKAEFGEDYSNHSFSSDYIKDAKVRLEEQRDYDLIMKLLENAVVPEKTDSELLVIITEEAAPYFDGRKTIDETLEMIKNRAGIYISEHQ
jgi:ABC-type glycerol-3-phosphate transport system substrate-binding protein